MREKLTMDWSPKFALLLALCCITGIQSASLHTRPSCRVDDIKLKEDFDVKKFAGKWYDIGRLDLAQQSADLASGYSQFIVTEEGRLEQHYVGKIAGECQKPFTGVSETFWGPRLHFRFPQHSLGPQSGPFWVVDTDYNNYAIIYGCYHRQVDGTCSDDYEMMHVLGRQKGIRPSQRIWLENMVEQELCVDPTKIRFVTNSAECPSHQKSVWNIWGMLEDEVEEAAVEVEEESKDEPSADADEQANQVDQPAVCKFEDIPVTDAFDEEQILGKWYILASHREKSDKSRSDGMFQLYAGENGYLESLFTGAHNGVCLPTFFGVLRATDVKGQYSVQNEMQNGPLKFAYMTSDLQYAVTYQCSDMQQDGTCGKVTVDVCGRTTDFPEEVKADLRPVVESYCVKHTDFSSIPQDLNCVLHSLDEEPSCLVADIESAQNVDWSKQTGTWYTVAAYRDKEAPSLTFHLESQLADDGTTKYYNWMGYARNGECAEPMKAEALVSNPSGDITLVAGGKTRHGHLVFTDNGKINMFYECGRTLEDGTCDPSFTKVHVSMKSRTTEKHVIRALKVILRSLCVKLENVQVVDHTIPCEANPALYVAKPPVPENPIADEAPVPENPIAVEAPVPENLPEIEAPIPENLPEIEAPVPENLPEIEAPIPENLPEIDPPVPENLPEIEADASAEKLKVVQSDDKCAFVNLKSQDDFDPAQFEGLWYHIYRLKSHHEYESEVNFIEDLQNGQMTAISAHYHDGHCSDTEVSTYTKSKKISGDWSFGKYGGVKILYTDYNYAVVYVCDEVHKDGSCDKDHVEVEVLSKNKDAVPSQVKDKLVSVIEGACLTKADFEEIKQNYDCPLLEISCPISDLPEQADFNVDKFTGTWQSIAHVRRNSEIESVTTRFTKTDTGYHTDIAFKTDGQCMDRHYDWSPQDGTATLLSPSGKGIFKVLYTDYESALVYVCHKMYKDHCVPDHEHVFATSRTARLTDSQLIDMVDTVAETCFTRDNFVYIAETEQCDINVPSVKIADLPKAEDLEVATFVGRWYGQYHLHGHGDWQDGVVDYELLEDGSIKVSGTGSDGEKCLDSISYLSFPTEEVYEWNIMAGGQPVYIRVLDVNPDSYTFIYMCDKILEDGTCDPDRTFIDVLSRSQDDFSVETLAHLRDVIRQAGFAPGDFRRAKNAGLDCEVVHYPDFTCNVNELVGMEGLNTRKLSGKWYVAAKLNGTNVLGSEWAKIVFEDESTFTLNNVGYRQRRGCSLTGSIKLSLDGPNFEAEVGGKLIKGVVLWTDYEAMMTYDCYNVLEDGTCAVGSQRALVLSRYPGRLAEEVIAKMDGVSDQPCTNRENFQWVEHSVHCPMELDLPDSCKVENIELLTEVKPEMFEGIWYTTYMLRQEMSVMEFSEFKTEWTFSDDGIISSRFSFKGDGDCKSVSGTLYPTDKPGSYKLHLGNIVQDYRFLYVDEKHAVFQQCGQIRADGFCEDNELGILVRTRDISEPTQEVLDNAQALANKLCFQTGDFVPVVHEGDYCPLPDPPTPLACSVDEMPIQEDFLVDRFTGTWYAVAKLKGHAMMPSSVYRLMKDASGTYIVLSAGLQPRGGCRHVSKATVMEDNHTPGDVYLATEGGKRHLRILYTDYEFALAYECLHVLEDGSCRPGSDLVAAYARTPHLPDDAIQRMIPVAEKACFTRDDFEAVPHSVACDLGEYEPLSCRVRDIPTQENFQLDRFLGTWYSHFKYPATWETVVHVIEKNDDGSVTLHFSGEKNGECVDPVSIHWEVSKGNPAVMYRKNNGVLSGMKIVHTDYVSNAVVYACGHVLEDGTCEEDTVYIQVMGRSMDSFSDEQLEHLREAVRDTCFEPGDFETSTHTRNCEPFREIGCKVEDLPSQDDFDMNKFTGKWNIAARIRNSGQTESGVIGIKFHKEGEYLAYVTGAVAGECQDTHILTMHPNYKGKPADMHLEYGDREGFLRVLYTDYENALIYLCEEVRPDGRCVPSKFRLLAVTRGEEISNTKLRIMAGVAKRACFTADQFEWVNREVHCALDVELMDECKPANLVTADSVTLDQVKGTWFLRYTLRGRIHHDSVVYNFEALENGDIRYGATAALNGQCVDTTVVSLAYKTDDPAIWKLNSHRLGEVEGEIKVLYIDSDYAVMYECDRQDADGFCYWNKIQVSVLSRNKDEITEEKRTELIEVARAACLEPGMFAEVEHPVECPLAVASPYTCDGGELPSVENFSMEKMTGSWYAVAKLKGSPVPNSFVTRISLSDENTYKLEFRGARRGRCIETASSEIIQAEDGSSKFHIVKDGVKRTVSHVAFTNYEVALMKGCLLLQDDGTCAQGHEQVAVYARSPDVPGEDVIAQMEVAGHSLCVDRSLFEAVRHDLACPIDTPVEDRCLEANIPAQQDFSLDSMVGQWYSLYRLRDTGHMDFGTALLTKVGDHHIKGEFSFHVNGQCLSVEAMYHHVHSPDKPAVGEFYTNIGNFQASVKLIAANPDYMLLYECEHVGEDGLCSHGGRFVGVFGKSPDAPPPEILTKLRQLVRDVCLEPGDFVATEHTSTCDLKIEKATLNCPISELPTKEDHIYNKDTGTWYAVAKLKGSNFLRSHVERGIFDEKNQVYKFYFTGERARGGCTPTGTTEVGVQHLGESGGTIKLTSGTHNGIWKTLYNDYKFSLYYECSHMLDEEHCAPGYETITAYSRRRENIPEHMILKMFENIPQNCFTREDFEWIPHTTECPLEFDYPDCRVRQIPLMENLDIDQVLGTWYSRYLLTAHANFDSYSVRYEKTDTGLRGHYTGLKMGKCQRSMHLDSDVPNSKRGIWHRIKDGHRAVTKVMWTDYNYAAVYTCDEVLGDDHCAPDKDYIDVLARDLQPIPVTVIEWLKKVLQRACYEPGDLVESDHNVECEEDTCSVNGVKTQTGFKVSDVYGEWNLVGRTTHLKLDRGPSTMKIMKAPGGNARLSLARHHEHGCNTYQTELTADGEATFYFSFSGLPGLLKVLHASDEHLLIYECFGVEPVDGYCPEENEEVQAWDREYHRDDEHEDMLRGMSEDATCVDLGNTVALAENTECKVPESCKLADFVAQEDLDPRSLLGNWVLRVRTTFHEAQYNSNQLKFAYTGTGVGSYSISGEAAATGECTSHFGTVEELEGNLFQFSWDENHDLGKFLYVDDDSFALLECLTELDFGECPLESTVLLGYARNYDPAQDAERIKREIWERTHGCFDFPANIQRFDAPPAHECDEPADPEGKLSCAVDGLVAQKDLDPKALEGAWFLIARTGTIDLAWDSGLLHSTVLDDGVVEFKYTGLVSYDSDECLEVYTEQMHPTDEPGHFKLVTERLGGLNSVAKILYADDDHFIWYECQGSRFTGAGACERESEHVEVFSRRRRINSVDKQKLADQVKDMTCVDLDTFVMANHTHKCDLFGVTDKHLDGRSCRLQDYPTQENFDPEQFAGLWYEIERTRYSTDNVWESGLSHFEHQGDNMMTFSYTGTRQGACSGPFTAFVKPVADNPADMHMYIGDKDLIGSPWSVYFKYRVIYTDYKVALTHACLIWNADGTCRQPGEQVDILSRTPDLDASTRSQMYDIIRDNLCVHVYDLVEPAKQESCHMTLGLEVPVDCSKRPMCAMHCEHGFVDGDDGCPVCECKETEMLEDSSGEGSGEEAEDIENGCPLMMCMIECEFGMQTDEQGCDLCACNEAPVNPCPLMMCMIECEFGMKTDEQGCDLCECNEAPVNPCPLMMCMIECEFGMKTDEQGCDLCECNEAPTDPCPPMMCMIECEFGMKTDEQGCDLCECNEAPAPADPCPPMMCMVECEFGMKTDEQGCDLCECNESPEETEAPQEEVANEEAVNEVQGQEEAPVEEVAQQEVEEANAVQGKDNSLADTLENLFSWF